MREHSPIPWTWERAGEEHYAEFEDFPFVIRDAADWNVAAVIQDVPDLPAEANAAFIVRAVNAHDDLVAALRLVSMSKGWQYLSDETREVIRAALAKAAAGTE